MKKAVYENNAPVVYLFNLHTLAGKCTRIYNGCRNVVRHIKPQLVLRRFRCRWGIKSHDVDLSLCSVHVCFYICDLNLEVIEKIQANNYRLPHWKKTVPFVHGNFRKFALKILVEW